MDFLPSFKARTGWFAPSLEVLRTSISVFLFFVSSSFLFEFSKVRRYLSLALAVESTFGRRGLSRGWKLFY